MGSKDIHDVYADYLLQYIDKGIPVVSTTIGGYVILDTSGSIMRDEPITVLGIFRERDSLHDNKI